MIRIKVKDFGPIREAFLKEDGWMQLPKFTVFIGNQGSSLGRSRQHSGWNPSLVRLGICSPNLVGYRALELSLSKFVEIRL
ncbi:MAG: hypothetical protein ACJLTB_05890 [Algoriphagus aquaeductus]|uniref:hypothetical protein n=1 Tax=Algoriphagus aquaeductus TaxID=475299 RepID=UPI00387934C1